MCPTHAAHGEVSGISYAATPQDWASRVFYQFQQKDSDVSSLTGLAAHYFTHLVVASEWPLSTQVLVLTSTIYNLSAKSDW